LLTALAAGLDQGGEAGPVPFGVALYVVREASWPIADLRVDWNDRPVVALQELWAVYKPQLEELRSARAATYRRPPDRKVAGDTRI